MNSFVKITAWAVSFLTAGGAVSRYEKITASQEARIESLERTCRRQDRLITNISIENHELREQHAACHRGQLELRHEIAALRLKVEGVS